MKSAKTYTNALTIYDLNSGETIPMPIDDLKPLIKNTLRSAISRKLFLNKLMSKFAGLVLKNKSASLILDKTGINKKISSPIATRYRKLKSHDFNAAFSHRLEDRPLYPTEKSQLPEKTITKIFCSPADSYINIRHFSGSTIELYPELHLDLKAMIGPEFMHLFPFGGTALFFTLKPFHDHTIDYPIESKVIQGPIEKNKKKFRINSTDLVFANFMSTKKHQTIFDQNHRVITELQAIPYQESYLYIEVGAILVNSIQQDNCELEQIYQKGQQKSHFNFGSTVILLLPKSFTDKITFPTIYFRGVNTSIHVQRGNVLALPIDFPKDQKIALSRNCQYFMPI